jgi:hypothetical protein
MLAAADVERQKLALDAIKQALGTEAGEDSVNLFVEHHLEELPSSGNNTLGPAFQSQQSFLACFNFARLGGREKSSILISRYRTR